MTDKSPQGLTFSDLAAQIMRGATLEKPGHIGLDGREHRLVPDGYTLKDITDPHRLPPHAAARIVVDDRDSLQNYVNRFSTRDTVILADYDAGTITAQLDWHPPSDQDTPSNGGSLKHSAQLVLRPSEEFKRWNAFATGGLKSQADFALFLEENAADIWQPEPTEMLELARDLEAASGQTFKTRTRLENGDSALVFESETKVTSRVQPPREFTVHIPLYQGEEPEALQALFRWRASSGVIQMGFIWHRVEYMRQARFNQIAFAAAENTGRPVFFGRNKTPA